MSNHLSRLDASMVRCNVVFINSYRFNGSIDEIALKNSVSTLLSKVVRFQQRMDSDKKYKAQWYKDVNSCELLTVIETDNVEETIVSIYQGIHSSHINIPMFFILLKDRNLASHFTILQCGHHSYCDGNSASLIFNQIIRYYNAVLIDNNTEQQKIIDEVSILSTPSMEEIFSKKTQRSKKSTKIGRWENIKNIIRLATYKVVDKAQFTTPHKILPSRFEQFNRTPAKPVTCYFDVNRLVEECSHYYADVSPTNMVCALVAKAFYLISSEEKKLTNAHQISFRVMMDLLNFPMRKKYIGNYIAYLPVTVDGRLPIYEIAHAISQRLYQAKSAKEDISIYNMLEFALSSGIANKTNGPVSYIIANISNITIANNPYFLQDAECYEYKAIANTAPVDLRGAQLNNCPTLCFNLLPNNQLCLSFFNTVIDPEIPNQLLSKIEKSLQQVTKSASVSTVTEEITI